MTSSEPTSNGSAMDWPAKYVELLEKLVNKIRSVTIDPASRWLTVATLILPLLVLALLIVFFLFFTIYGMLAIPLGTSGALGVLGGLFLGGSALLWIRRKRVPTETAEEPTS